MASRESIIKQQPNDDKKDFFEASKSNGNNSKYGQGCQEVFPVSKYGQEHLPFSKHELKRVVFCDVVSVFQFKKDKADNQSRELVKLNLPRK